MNDTNTQCANISKALEDYEFAPWWTTLIKDAVSVLGIVGNIILSGVRMQRHLRNTFNKLLVALAVFDSLALATGLMYSTMKRDKVMTSYFIWPFGHVVITGSIFMTVVIGYERYKAVLRPLDHKLGERYRVLRYVALVTISAVVFNVTKFFEYEPDNCGDSMHFSELYMNKVYLVYNIVVYRLLITGLIPSLMLIYMYAKMYKCIEESHSFRGEIAREDIEVSDMVKKEGKHAHMFAGVVAIFIICNIPDVIVKIVKILHYFKGVREPPLWLLIMVKVRDFCLMLNSAINIVIYTSLSKEFRSELRKAFHKFVRGTFIFTGRHNSVITSNSVLENTIFLRDVGTMLPAYSDTVGPRGSCRNNQM